MKHTRICPNCGITEIYRVEAVVGNGYGLGNILPIGLFGVVKVNRYVCGNCGKCTEWNEGKELETLKRKFSRA